MIIVDNEKAYVTYKSGDYHLASRIETEILLSPDQVKSFLTIITSLGLNECSYLETERYSFSKNGINYDLSKHQHLGMFLEIEIMVGSDFEIGPASQAITQELISLNLKEDDG